MGLNWVDNFCSSDTINYCFWLWLYQLLFVELKLMVYSCGLCIIFCDHEFMIFDAYVSYSMFLGWSERKFNLNYIPLLLYTSFFWGKISLHLFVLILTIHEKLFGKSFVLLLVICFALVCLSCLYCLITCSSHNCRLV